MDHVSSNAKSTSFYSTYMSLCKNRNVPAILELIKSKNKLDFAADRIRTDQWDLICKSLAQDNVLEFLEIRSRKSYSLENGAYEQDKRQNVILTLIGAVSCCLERNSVLTKLALEGLPFSVDNIQIISTAISKNSSLKSISFARSNILDEGCNVICGTIRNLPNIEKLNLSHCNLTTTAADSVGELIKFQMISRNSEGWMKSLRYRDVDVDSVAGLKCLILNGNQLLDKGLQIITSRLKEDMWMKAIEVQNCDISDVGGEAILDCLKFNKTLLVFDASHNDKISHKLHKRIQMILNMEPENYETMPKVTNADLRERIEFLEQKLQLETFNRTRADDLNVQLHQNLLKCDQEVAEKLYQPPSGFKMIESGALNALYKEIEDLVREKETLCMENTKEAVERDVEHYDIGELSGCGENFDFKDRSGCGENFGFEEKCHVGEQSDVEEPFYVEEQSDIEERSDFAMQSGFGDTLTISEQKTCDNSNSNCRELKRSDVDTFVDFTSYSQASSCDMSSKFDDDVMSVNSEDVYCANKRNSVFEEPIGYDQYMEQGFGDGNCQQFLECKRGDLFGTAK